MAATQIARSNSTNPFAGLDEFVNLPPSPSVTPRLSSAKPAPVATMASASTSTAATPINMRTVGLDQKQTPPPPGSSPEALFRYYLAAELRKAGTQPDEALLDRYVKNHFESLFTNKQASKTVTQQAAQPISLQRLPAASQPMAQAAIPAAVVATSAPVAGPSSLSHTVERGASSPPELQGPDSPSLSGKSYSPVSTPPALDAVDEEQDGSEAQYSKAFKQPAEFADAPMDLLNLNTAGSSSLASLDFFRTSPFRFSTQESVSIDPNMVQLDSASPFTMTRQPVAPRPADLLRQGSVELTGAQSDAAMSEDGFSDKEDSKSNLAKSLGMDAQFRLFEPSRFGSEETSHASGSDSYFNGAKIIGSASDLRPDPEEYKKLSSKEKRQLRNKISARNFRTRRKEYIGHLEEQVADRDSIIDGLRAQLSQMTMENKSLQEEVRILKNKTISSTDVGKILEALQKNLPPTLAMPPAAATASVQSVDYGMGPATPSAFLNMGGDSRPATPTSMTSFGVPSSPRPTSPRPSMLRRSSPSIITQPNTKKDVGPQSSFWGGVGTNNGQSFMPVC